MSFNELAAKPAPLHTIRKAAHNIEVVFCCFSSYDSRVYEELMKTGGKANA